MRQRGKPCPRCAAPMVITKTGESCYRKDCRTGKRPLRTCATCNLWNERLMQCSDDPGADAPPECTCEGWETIAAAEREGKVA